MEDLEDVENPFWRSVKLNAWLLPVCWAFAALATLPAVIDPRNTWGDVLAVFNVLAVLYPLAALLGYVSRR